MKLLKRSWERKKLISDSSQKLRISSINSDLDTPKLRLLETTILEEEIMIEIETTLPRKI